MLDAAINTGFVGSFKRLWPRFFLQRSWSHSLDTNWTHICMLKSFNSILAERQSNMMGFLKKKITVIEWPIRSQ